MLPKLLAGELVCLSTPGELPDGVDRSNVLRFDLKSTVAIPLSVAHRIVGAVSFGMTRREREWPPEILQRLRVAASMFSSVLARRHNDEALRRGARRSRALERSAAAENVYLRGDVEAARHLGHRPERRDSPCAGTGVPGGRDRRDGAPSGRDRLGKEVFAARIHELSRRRARAMVASTAPPFRRR